MKSTTMALILSIDTALETAGICLSDDSSILGTEINTRQSDHAAWIHSAVQKLLSAHSRKRKDLAAIAVTSGPGSYTGLRVGMATAKGLCYALNIPLITQSTLQLFATTVKKNLTGVYPLPVLICSMIDARRMEVFTALYDLSLSMKMPPSALVLDTDSFADELKDHLVIFCGNSNAKWQNICMHPNAMFDNSMYSIGDLATTACGKYDAKEFSELAYTEPFYLKNVYTGTK